MRKDYVAFLTFFLITFVLKCFSQTDCGSNAGFETGTTAGWTCKYGTYGSVGCPSVGLCPTFPTILNNFGCLNANGINAPLTTGVDRHTITTGPGTDPNSIAP